MMVLKKTYYIFQINLVSINNFDELDNNEKLYITVLITDESVEYQNYIFFSL